MRIFEWNDQGKFSYFSFALPKRRLGWVRVRGQVTHPHEGGVFYSLNYIEGFTHKLIKSHFALAPTVFRRFLWNKLPSDITRCRVLEYDFITGNGLIWCFWFGDALESRNEIPSHVRKLHCRWNWLALIPRNTHVWNASTRWTSHGKCVTQTLAYPFEILNGLSRC